LRRLREEISSFPAKSSKPHPSYTSDTTVESLNEIEIHDQTSPESFFFIKRQTLEIEIHRILLSSSTVEGKTISAFHKNFPILLKNPSKLLDSIREFIDNLKVYIEEHHEERFNKLLEENSSPESKQSNSLSIANMLERILQRVVIYPLQERILETIGSYTAEKDRMLNDRILDLRERTQEMFGIPDYLISADLWESAINEFELIDRCEIPTDKLSVILSTSRVISDIANLCKQKHGKEAGFLSADEFLPVFMYVVCHSNVTNLERLFEYLYQLTDSTQLYGEIGYYLTVLASTLQFFCYTDIQRDKIVQNRENSFRELVVVSRRATRKISLRAENKKNFHADASLMNSLPVIDEKTISTNQDKGNQITNNLVGLFQDFLVEEQSTSLEQRTSFEPTSESNSESDNETAQ